MAVLHVSIRMRIGGSDAVARSQERDRRHSVLRRIPREMNTLYVMLFGALGAAARFGVGHAVAREGSELPWHTLLVNAGGSFLFGILAMTPREAEFADLIRFGL